TLDIPEYGEIEFEPIPEAPEDLYEAPVFPEHLPEPEEILPQTQPQVQVQVQPEPIQPISGGVRFTPEEQHFIDELKVDRAYRFDPNVAANELGLPVDLIEEFIGDFIQQSHDFKDDLFEAAMKGDMNNLKILSHKLKGVAANLRIEDALECLSIVNTSEDIVEIEANLKYFYGIIGKLEGKEPVFLTAEAQAPSRETIEEVFEPVRQPEPATDLSADEDIYAFALKTERDEPLPTAPAKAPDFSLALKHDDNEPLMVQLEELNAMEEAPAGFSDTFEEQPLAEESVPVCTLHYDKTAIAGQLGIESAFFDELIDDYKRDAQIAAQQIAGAIGAFDTHLWKKTASQLKGISDNLRLSEISDELAVLSRTNDAQEAHKASKRLTSYLEQL
ncbi:MAG: Hpt domain-containing protein, partial [Campylobacterales bacterium]|nr:Hpt domain-containing protein [Campylobacterales bacterium]